MCICVTDFHGDLSAHLESKVCKNNELILSSLMWVCCMFSSHVLGVHVLCVLSQKCSVTFRLRGEDIEKRPL